MATYYVDGNSGNDSNNGSGGSPWRTLTKARNSVKAGDEVRIRSATYHEQLTINTANTTWKADTGNTPILDGGYNDSLMYKDKNGLEWMPPPGSDHLPKGEWGSMILVAANGVVVDGLTVRSSAGAGVGMANIADVVVRNCRIDFTYLFNMHVTGGVGWGERVVFENNILTRGSVKTLIPGLGNWDGGIAIGRGRDCVVRNNVIAYAWGEGIDAHRGSTRTIVEGNVVHSCMSTHIYVQHSKDDIIRNNLVYHTGHPSFSWRGSTKVSEGIQIADERESAAFHHSSGTQIYNNIVIGTGILFNVVNGSPIVNTQLNKTYIGYNTFVGNSRTYIGIRLIANDVVNGRPHVNSIFENNIICNIPSGALISYTHGDLKGILFRNNLWDVSPVTAVRGTGDRIGNPGLVNPTAAIVDGYPNPAATVDPRNFQLTSSSNLSIGMASDGSTANGLTPPSVRKDFFGVNRDNQPDIGAHEYVGVTIELTANFSIGPGQGSGHLPHTVDFVDKSMSTQPIVSRTWNFGDGETSTETNPSHTYNNAGSFDVSLTITDDLGNTHTAKQVGMISVSEAPNVILPDSFRRFVLLRKEQQVVLAYGTQYPDMTCILIWNMDPFHILNFDNILDVEESNLESGNFELLWIDPGSQIEPAAIEPAPGPTAVSRSNGLPSLSVPHRG